MSLTSDTQGRRAIGRGMEFIHRVSLRPGHFDEHGSDLLSCFYFISHTSKWNWLRRLAREMGAGRARRWRQINARIPLGADAGAVIDLVHGSVCATGLGFPDAAFGSRLREAVGRFTAMDFLSFDPTVEAPPSDVPRQCYCGRYNERGRRRCRECRRRLTMARRYATWYYALMRAYTGDRFGAPAGAGYADVLRSALDQPRINGG
jgi:hypothetical protein